MNDNFLITGYWGEPHVTAENDRGINAATFGAGRFVLPVGEQFRAEYIGNNTIRMYDGKLMNNGAAAGIPVGEYVDLLIANAGQGKKRNDLIVFQYSQDASTLVESGKFVVIQGAETSGTASDPTLTQENLLSGKATFDQMALWRVSVSGGTIAAPVKLFKVSNSIPSLIDTIYPVGSIYMSVNNVNPSALFGGTWVQLKDQFLLGAGDTYAAGAKGGSADAVIVEHDHFIFGRDAGAEVTDYVSGRCYVTTYVASGDRPYTLKQSANQTEQPINGVTSKTGVSGVGKNMPPYLAVYMWKRTA